MPAGAPLAGECLVEERFDEGSNRRHDCLPSAMNAFTGRGDVAHEVGGGLQVPVGRVDVDVTHVGRKRHHMRAASASIRRTALQRAHRERVPQIVQTRAAPRRRYDTCPADQPVEGLFDRDVAQRQTTCVNEHRIGFGTRAGDAPDSASSLLLPCRAAAPGGFSGTWSRGSAGRRASRRRPSTSALRRSSTR